MKQTFNIHQKKQKYILNNIFIFIFSLDEYVYTRNIHSRSQRFEVKTSTPQAIKATLTSCVAKTMGLDMLMIFLLLLVHGNLKVTLPQCHPLPGSDALIFRDHGGEGLICC